MKLNGVSLVYIGCSMEEESEINGVGNFLVGISIFISELFANRCKLVF